jgi:AraC-like DNA-binding protein
MDTISEFWRDPAMPYAESRRACHSRACYKPHSHPTFSIGAVDQGVSRFTGAISGPVTLHVGTIVFVPASHVHACNPEPDTAWSYQMLHLDAAWLHAVRQEYAQEDVNCWDREPARIVAEPTVYARFCRLNMLLFSQASPHDKEAALIEFMGECDTAQGLRLDIQTISPRLSEQIQPVLGFLRDEAAINTGLSDLARLAGISRYQLIRAFRATTGMTPHAWQLNQRVNLAREWIREGERIAEVAYRLGFADQAHFQRVFKAHTGITPGRFRT